MRVAFVTHSLDTGGSERQVAVLAKGLAAAGHDVTVVVLRPGGSLDDELRRDSTVRWVTLGTPTWYGPRGLRRIASALRSVQADVVHPYQSLPNVVVTLLRPFLGDRGLVWGVRDADMESIRQRRGGRTVAALSRPLSRLADLIIVNSEAGRRFHIGRGYPERKLVVIQNGIETDRFRPDPAGRQRVRQEWGVADDQPLIGIVARPHPVKDHRTFIEAASIVARRVPSAMFVCVGRADGPQQSALQALVRTGGLEDRLRWAGERTDMPAVYAALDVCCLSSTGEGFPNVVAEAMACGTACVVTDVGDAAEIVGEIGVVVPPRDPCALAEGMASLLGRVERERDSLGTAARARIEENYSVDRLVGRTAGVLHDVVSQRR
jgi:glycosyltransferase involved in cell wall biosynthesis